MPKVNVEKTLEKAEEYFSSGKKSYGSDRPECFDRAGNYFKAAGRLDKAAESYELAAASRARDPDNLRKYGIKAAKAYDKAHTDSGLSPAKRRRLAESAIENYRHVRDVSSGEEAENITRRIERLESEFASRSGKAKKSA